MRDIHGGTRIIAHIGWPTTTFTAPLIYNPWFEKIGLDTAVVPMGCREGDLEAFLPACFRLGNVDAAMITMPHKQTVVGLLDRVSARVRAAGSCNAVRRAADGALEGDLFDGEGFLAGCRAYGRRIEGASALVVGAGGVGSAIAASLAEAGAARLGLFDTRAGAAEALAKRLAGEFPNVRVSIGSADPSGWQIVVNATPLGMAEGDPLPIDADRLDPESFVGEVVLKPETPFLAAARARGCATQVGTDMLFAQIPANMAFFGLPEVTAEELRAVARLRT